MNIAAIDLLNQLESGAALLILGGLVWLVKTVVDMDKRVTIMEVIMRQWAKRENIEVPKPIARNRGVALLLLLLIVFTFTGCLPGGGRGFSMRPFETRTNAVAQVLTIPATTNTIASPAGPVVIVTPEKVSTNWTTNVLVEVNPVWTRAIETAKTVNETANPTPTAPIVNIALLAVSGVLGWIARLKTKQAGRAGDLLDTVIAGVEVAKSPETKSKIEEISKLWGTRNALHERVQQITDSKE